MVRRTSEVGKWKNKKEEAKFWVLAKWEWLSKNAPSQDEKANVSAARYLSRMRKAIKLPEIYYVCAYCFEYRGRGEDEGCEKCPVAKKDRDQICIANRDTMFMKWQLAVRKGKTDWTILRCARNFLEFLKTT